MAEVNVENKPMEFRFTCPVKSLSFMCSDFTIIENNGIKTDKEGNKFLDARIRLEDSCPYCGKQHVYHISQIACPFRM